MLKKTVGTATTLQELHRSSTNLLAMRQKLDSMSVLQNLDTCNLLVRWQRCARCQHTGECCQGHEHVYEASYPLRPAVRTSRKESLQQTLISSISARLI